MNYYNENDPKAAAWLRELIKEKLIPEGTIDERSIEDVRAGDLAGFTQCHFFAGIGGWPLALSIAGWPEDKPVYSASCPCQPFSGAGKRLGNKDPRHLWPVFRNLVAERRPAIIVGEQVASKDGRLWLNGVRTDLEALAYAVGAADLCAASIGAPHIRQRLYWVAHAQCNGGRSDQPERQAQGRVADGRIGGVVQPNSSGREAGESATEATRYGCAIKPAGGIGGMEHAASDRREQRRSEPSGRGASSGCGNGGMAQPASAERIIGPNLIRGDAQPEHSDAAKPGATGGMGNTKSLGRDVIANDKAATERGKGAFGIAGAWSKFDLIPCRDGKTRRIESGTFPLAHGVPGRVGLLRGYGNAIVPELAAEFIIAFTEAQADLI